MPLLDSASPKAFKTNVSTEVDAKKAEGYSPKKAAEIATAIAYRIKRKAQHKKG